MPGLIVEGGGMRAGFAAGALMALMDKKLTCFKTAIAVSASVPTVAYFAAGQRWEIEHIWRNELHTPKLVCYRNIPAASITLSAEKPILNIDYLVYNIFKKQYPLNINTFRANPMVCRFAAATSPEGDLALLDPEKENIYDIFKACLAVPGCYPKPVVMNDRHYVDGATVDPLPIKSLLHKKPSKVLAILTKPIDCEGEPPNFLERVLFWRYFQKYEWMMEKLWEAAENYNVHVSLLEQLSEETPPRAMIICPEEMPPVKFITRDGKKIHRTIELGYEKVEKLEKKIRKFLYDTPCKG